MRSTKLLVLPSEPHTGLERAPCGERRGGGGGMLRAAPNMHPLIRPGARPTVVQPSGGRPVPETVAANQLLPPPQQPSHEMMRNEMDRVSRQPQMAGSCHPPRTGGISQGINHGGSGIAWGSWGTGPEINWCGAAGGSTDRHTAHMRANQPTPTVSTPIQWHRKTSATPSRRRPHGTAALPQLNCPEILTGASGRRRFCRMQRPDRVHLYRWPTSRQAGARPYEH